MHTEYLKPDGSRALSDSMPTGGNDLAAIVVWLQTHMVRVAIHQLGVDVPYSDTAIVAWLIQYGVKVGISADDVTITRGLGLFRLPLAPNASESDINTAILRAFLCLLLSETLDEHNLAPCADLATAYSALGAKVTEAQDRLERLRDTFNRVGRVTRTLASATVSPLGGSLDAEENSPAIHDPATMKYVDAVVAATAKDFDFEVPF